MTDTHDDSTERKDPVLVRPYIKTEVKSVAEAEAAETWPEDAPLPAGPGEADTLIQPAVDDPPPEPAAPEKRRAGLSGPLRLLTLVGGIALALGVGAYLIFGTGDASPPQPGTDLPRAPAEALAPTGGGTTGRPAASGTATPSATPSVSPSVTATVTPSPSVTGSAVSGAPVTTAPNPSAPPTEAAAPTLAPPPASDRTGSVTSAGGRCLALGSLLGMDGSPVQANSCANIAYQDFTVAADGTLRVNGRCAGATGDGTVRVDGCDEGGSAQWRAGQNGSLVNTSTGQCLTDPGRAGANTTVAACSGGADQTWTLP